VRGNLGRGDAFFRDPANGELIEHAVGAVRLDQTLDGEKRGGERGDPQRARPDARKQRCVRSDRKRHQGRNQEEEGDRKPCRAG